MNNPIPEQNLLINGKQIRALSGKTSSLLNPADGQPLAIVAQADAPDMDLAVEAAHRAFYDGPWRRINSRDRTSLLLKIAELIRENSDELAQLESINVGKPIRESEDEVQLAANCFEYYAGVINKSGGQTIPVAASGISMTFREPIGVCAQIIPWNFPIAIASWKIAPALAMGNTVIVKPASQTPLTALRLGEIALQAGIPPGVLNVVPGPGSSAGEALIKHPLVRKISFTGSTETAWRIQSALSERRGPILPLIAETGGQNVMIADSSALPEQLVGDVLQSAFNSAGQRCSALRVLFVQHEIADRVIHLLVGAMHELQIGDPLLLSTDVGPLIDRNAVRDLQSHVDMLETRARLLCRVPPPAELAAGSFFALHAFELESMDVLKKEVFGPVLHVLRFAARDLDGVIDSINKTGYGLTLGVHTRIEANWQRVRERARVGNLYVNRNMIGAVVGAQPFGGEGLSGTGPKAGGPYYLHRFATERTRSINTAAMGGNASLLSLSER